MARIGRRPEPVAHRVFSTEEPPAAAAPPAAGRAGAVVPVRVERTRAGRRGRTVTLVIGLPSSDLRDVARELRRLCGSGGAVKDGVVEVQGDHRDAVAAHLDGRYRVTVAGG